MATAVQQTEDPRASFTAAERERFEKIDPFTQEMLISILENRDAENLEEAVDRLNALGNWPVE